MPDASKVLSFIEKSEEPEKLKILIENARRNGAIDVEAAAFKRLIYISPKESPGSLEHALWSTIFAFEHLLKQEHGKTVLLARTRQKLNRVGVVQTLTDWASDTKETDGFRMLMERGMPELTGEAIVLRHADRFASQVVDSARARLQQHGVDESLIRSLERT